MSRIEAKLQEMGYTLPEVPQPVAAYIPAIRTGNLVMTSGQLPIVAGSLPVTGKVGGTDLSIEAAAGEAQRAALNALAAVKQVIGDLDKIRQVVRVVVYVQSADDFRNQPQVANGASTFLKELFGDAGQHTRSAVGTNALPLDSPVEVELTVEVAD